ncbi:MAG: hypothetical protein ACI87W_002958 [Halieaceae bacterium]
MLAIPVRKHDAFFGDAVDVGGLVTHHALVVRADIEPADVVTPDYEDVGFFSSECRRATEKACDQKRKYAQGGFHI